MLMEVVDNMRLKAADALTGAMESANSIRFAVAFASADGLDKLSSKTTGILRKGGSAEFLVGLDLRVTEPSALWQIYTWFKEYKGASLYCLAEPEKAALYHPKLYLVEAKQRILCLVGSSNLTAGGLERNLEINVLLSFPQDSGPASDLQAAYTRMKFHPMRVVPKEEFLRLYQELWGRARVSAERHVDANAASELRAAAGKLPRPKATRRDLGGWLGMVFDALPEGEFTNQDIYKHEQAFRVRYPENQNIRAKIQQQLQLLRDLELIEHVGPGRWRKR